MGKAVGNRQGMVSTPGPATKGACSFLGLGRGGGRYGAGAVAFRKECSPLRCSCREEAGKEPPHLRWAPKARVQGA